MSRLIHCRVIAKTPGCEDTFDWLRGYPGMDMWHVHRFLLWASREYHQFSHLVKPTQLHTARQMLKSVGASALPLEFRFQFWCEIDVWIILNLSQHFSPIPFFRAKLDMFSSVGYLFLRQHLALGVDNTQAWWRKQLPCWMPWLLPNSLIANSQASFGVVSNPQAPCFISVFSVRIDIFWYIFPIHCLIIIFRHLFGGIPKFQINPNIINILVAISNCR
jgi:hypothetical protein